MFVHPSPPYADADHKFQGDGEGGERNEAGTRVNDAEEELPLGPSEDGSNK